tara:strand:+ start:69 stop:302 length:234 start_codon:yes stop_codon:yes gene_type:complete
MLRREKQKVENKNVIKKDKNNMLMLSSFFFGSIIATSYLPLATIPKIEQILTYRPYTPKSSGVKYCVKIGVIIIGIN